ncbi:MAG: FAD-dependent oxidoreductase, partial [Pseudomonadota bacterium]
MKIAIIGSGIAGLSCAWLLSKHAGNEHQVTLFEKDSRLGGHTNTVDVTFENLTYPVDTGFLVFNERTYPNFIPMLAHLGVETAQSDMSFGIKLTNAAGNSRLEWCGSDSLSSVFAQPSNLFRPKFLGMLRDMLRFNKEASAFAGNYSTLTGTLGEYLNHRGYGQAFRDWYLVPMAACIWSTPTKRIDDFPLATFISFCVNHGLISVNNRPRWHTVKGGARNYVQKIAALLNDVRLNAGILGVRRSSGKVEILTASGTEMYDHVVLACHTHQSLSLLLDADQMERNILSSITYQPNTAVLHTDSSLLPTRRRAWAAWNYHAGYRPKSDQKATPVSLTYLLNKLQPIPFLLPVMVTMNPEQPIDPAKIIQTIQYDHPLFLAASLPAKRALRAQQGRRNSWYAGAWTRYG